MASPLHLPPSSLPPQRHEQLPVTFQDILRRDAVERVVGNDAAFEKIRAAVLAIEALITSPLHGNTGRQVAEWGVNTNWIRTGGQQVLAEVVNAQSVVTESIPQPTVDHTAPKPSRHLASVPSMGDFGGLHNTIDPVQQQDYLDSITSNPRPNEIGPKVIDIKAIRKSVDANALDAANARAPYDESRPNAA